MKAALLCFFLSALIAFQSAQARIGDTKAKLADRYGAGKEIGDQVLYTADRYSVTVFFNAEGKAAMEIYGLRPSVDGTQANFTDGDFKEFLHLESEGKEWQQLILKGTPTWRRSDNKVFARFIPNQGAFVVIGMDNLSTATMPGVNQIAPGQPLPTTPAP